MKTNTTHIQLSDGRRLSISGHNAERVAMILKNELTSNGSLSVESATDGEETPLELPTTNFEVRPRHAPDALVRNVPEGEETPLELPSTNLAKPRRGKAHHATEADDDAPLELPSTY